jgi:CRP/FNR family cyclic AMP-dependent transcriptional regulator
MQTDVLTSLKVIPFLANVSNDALHALALRGKQQKFSKHALIINEGDDGTSLYIVVSGKVRIFVRDEKSKEVTMAFQDAGCYFGELALLSNEPRSASVEAAEATVCCMVCKADFLAWLTENPDVMLVLLNNLTDKVRTLTEKVKRMAFSNVYERTIRALNEMMVADENGGGYTIHNRPTQHELATVVGASREMINKILKELLKGGYLKVEGKHWKVKTKLPIHW